MSRILAPSIPQDARRQQLMRMTANLPADVRAYIQETYGESQITVLAVPYWSTVRFQASIVGTDLVIDTSERKAFAYAQGQSMTTGGFLAAFGNATSAETNLLKQSETRDNADCWIWGLAAYVTQDSEGPLIARVWRETSTSISLNGTQSIPLGTLEMFPSAGGLYGVGQSASKVPDLATTGLIDGGAGASFGFCNNGNPMAGNFYRFQQPFKWSAVGSSGSDSSLVITSQPQRTITEPMGAARVAAAGEAVFTPPAAAGDRGTYVDVRWHLVCVSVAKRSVNV